MRSMRAEGAAKAEAAPITLIEELHEKCQSTYLFRRKVEQLHPQRCHKQMKVPVRLSAVFCLRANSRGRMRLGREKAESQR